MEYYPLNIKLRGRACAVVGGGAVAERKITGLLKAGARVTVFSPAVTDKLAELAGKGCIEVRYRCYQRGDLTGFVLVLCAADNSEVNSKAAAEAKAAGALVNVADNPDLSDFTVPAHIAQGDLLLTVSTGGKSPVLARRLREELALTYGNEYGQYLVLLDKMRQEVRGLLANSAQREAFWRQAVDKEILKLLRDGKVKEAEERIRDAASGIGTESPDGAGSD